MADLSNTIFIRLPVELQLKVIGNLDYVSAHSLSQTNGYYHSLVPFIPPKSDDQRELLLYDRESWPE